MAATVLTFRMLFPEFQTVQDDNISFWLDRTRNELNVDAWGEAVDDANLFLAAHRLQISRNRSDSINGDSDVSPGVIQTATSDGTTATFALPDYMTSGDSASVLLAQTSYGREFLALREVVFAGGRVIDGASAENQNFRST